MFGLSLLGKVVAGEAVEMRVEGCLRRYRRATCEACATQCPLGVVDLGRGMPRLAGDCIGCGVCVSVCPVGVFRLDPTARRELLAVARTAGPLDLGCTLGRTAGGRVPCLGYVGAGVLLALGAGDRPINLHVGRCGTCRLGSALAVVRQEVARANRAAGVVGLPATVRLVEDKVAQPVDDRDGAACSRRRFFGYLRGQGARAGAVAIAQWDQQLAFFDTERGEAAPTEHRGQTFVAQLRRLAARAGDTGDGLLPLPHPVVNDACDLCGLCAAACPSHALTLVDDGTDVALRWRAAGCWSCGLCQNVCPIGALRHSDGVPITAFTAQCDAVLASGSAAPCGDCGRRFVDRDSSTVCPRCRAERRPATAGGNPFGLGRPGWLGRQGAVQPTQGGSGP